jgi:NarL family two-component system response regulator LiaR
MQGIFILEDHEMTRRGLASWLSEDGRWTLAGSASSLSEAEAWLSSNPTPALLLLDVMLGSSFGLDILSWLKSRNSPLPALVYSAFEDYSHVQAAYKLGARGYARKSRGSGELALAIETVLSGKIYYDPALAPHITFVQKLVDCLTPREAQVLSLVQKRLSNQRIAEALGIQRKTVENMLCCIYDKTGIKGRRELPNL